MRRIVAVIVIAGAVFATYWAVAAQMVTRFAPDAIAQNARIDMQPGPVTGFPLAFRTNLENLQIQNRDQALIWHVPLATLEAASYMPNRISATLSQTQTLIHLGQSIALENESMQVDLALDHNLNLHSADLRLGNATAAPAIILSDLEMLTGALQKLEDSSYTLDISAQGLELSPELRRAIDPMGSHPERIEHFALDAEIALDRPLALNGTPPAPQLIDIAQMQLDWGEFKASGTGQLRRMGNGGFDGDFTVSLQDWRVLHRLLVETGILDRDAAMMAGFFLGGQAESGGTAITLTLNVSDSVIAFGPFVLGYLPRL